MARSQGAGAGHQAASQPAAQSGLPPDLRTYTPYPWSNGGVNQQASATSISDDEFTWLENMMVVGDGNLWSVNDLNPNALYTTPNGRTIVARHFFQLNKTGYAIVFLDDGSAIQIRQDNGTPTTIGVAGTFDLGVPPVIDTWGDKWLLIGTTSQYCIWDGAVLCRPGTLGPEFNITGAGGTYSSLPTVVISGGSGSGATATPTLSNGRVSKLVLTNPGSGYVFDDILRLKITFTGGGNTNKIAQGTASIGLGGVASISLTNNGSNYTISATGAGYPAVTITDPIGAGAGATAIATVNGLSVGQILITNPGANYSAVAVSISAPTGTGGVTATAVGSASQNGITSITITDGGSGYNTNPTVVVTDPTGSGTGFQGYAVMGGAGGDQVASVVIQNPGINYRDAVVRFIGGNPKVAAATASIMPQGGLFPVSATDIHVFKNRVWMVNGTHRYTSAPGSVTDFAASDGGVISENTDSFLTFGLFGLTQSGTFLYEFGDSSINAISNPVASTANGVTTTAFTVSNISPQIGTVWTQTIQPYENAIIFARSDGVYGIFGSQVKKISDQLDNLFGGNFPSQPFTPSACVVQINNRRCYVLNITITDPFTNANRQVLLCWDTKRWFVATQSVSLLAITGALQDPFLAYGDSGTALYRMFAIPSTSITKKIYTKFYGMDSPLWFKQALRFYITAQLNFTYDVVIHNELGTDVDLGSVTYPDAAGPNANNFYNSRMTVMMRDALGATGRFLGWSLTSTSGAIRISYMALAYRHYSPYYS